MHRIRADVEQGFEMRRVGSLAAGQIESDAASLRLSSPPLCELRLHKSRPKPADAGRLQCRQGNPASRITSIAAGDARVALDGDNLRFWK